MFLLRIIHLQTKSGRIIRIMSPVRVLVPGVHGGQYDKAHTTPQVAALLQCSVVPRRIRRCSIIYDTSLAEFKTYATCLSRLYAQMPSHITVSHSNSGDRSHPRTYIRAPRDKAPAVCLSAVCLSVLDDEHWTMDIIIII